MADLSVAQRAFGHLLVPTLIYTAWGFLGCSGHLARCCVFALEDSFARSSLSTIEDALLGDSLVSRRAFNYLLGHTLIHTA